MFNDYYKQELRRLRELAVEFADSHPSLAGLLKGPSADPDVERILEGTAFLTADLRRKLDDQLPEVLHALAQAVCPQHLRPIPAATVMAFKPRSNLKQTLRVAAGTHLDSVPVGGHPCRFRTCFDVKVSPLAVTGVSRPDDAQPGELRIRLSLAAQEVALDSLELDNLRLYLGGDLLEAADLYALLNHQLREIQVRTERAVSVLRPSALRPVGWGEGEQLLPRPRNVLPAYGALQDYFLFPEKYLFLDLDLSEWRARSGTRVDIDFVCAAGALSPPPLNRDRFVLHATPAVNLFEHEAEPLALDHRQAELMLRPAGRAPGELWIFSVDQVQGIARGAGGKRAYRPLSAFAAGAGSGPVYQTVHRPAPIGEGVELYLSVALPPEEPLVDKEILKVGLTCCDGRRPEALVPGDIRVPTRDTPELVDFSNLTAPTPGRLPPLEGELMWQLIAHLSLNYLSLAEADNLKALLRHYAGGKEQARARDIANQKRIDAIAGLSVAPEERLFGRAFVRGQSLRLSLRAEAFASQGDQYLFGMLLNRFFASCAALNSFTALCVEDAATGARMSWPAMIGTQPLL